MKWIQQDVQTYYDVYKSKCGKKLVNLYPSNEDKRIYICKECKGGADNGK